MKQVIQFLYRDADNYKFPFTRVVETREPLAEGDEVDYTHLGITQDEFHRSIVKYPYDEQSDHHIVEVYEACPSDDEADLTYIKP